MAQLLIMLGSTSSGRGSDNSSVIIKLTKNSRYLAIVLIAFAASFTCIPRLAKSCIISEICHAGDSDEHE